MIELTPEMRAEMRKQADTATICAHERLGMCGAWSPQSALALLDYCDRLEREFNAAVAALPDAGSEGIVCGSLADHIRLLVEQNAAAHERMREMKEALEHIEQNDAFWANNGPLPRVLADYRKGNADG